MPNRVTGVFVAAAAVWSTGLAAMPDRGTIEVVRRAFIGTYIEDVTYVSQGPYARHLVAATGDGLYAMPVSSRSRSSLQRILDLRDGPGFFPRGIAYIEGERAFALTGSYCEGLAIIGANSRPIETRPIAFPAGFSPTYCEGLGYVPDTSPVYPGHLLLAAMQSTAGGARIEVMTTVGQVVAEILPPEPVRSEFIGGVAFKAPDRILFGRNGNATELWTIDFAGNETAPRLPFSANQFLEGVVQVEDGRVFATGGLSELLAFDASLTPLPDDNRDFQLGIGVAVPRGIAWDPAAQALLVNGMPVENPSTRGLFAIPPSLDSAGFVADLLAAGTGNPAGLTYLPSQALTGVVSVANPPPLRRIFLLAGAGLVDAVALDSGDRLAAAEYLPATDEFAVRTVSDSAHVRIVTRSGTFIRQFDPRPPGVASAGVFTYFRDAHGDHRLLFLMSGYRLVVTDLDGNILRDIDPRPDLNLIEPNDLAAITTGPDAGAFAVTESTPGTVTIFRLR